MAEPLVSIVVITYNSSKFVLETLESCKAQTYKNIELIISDDASSDDTVQLCEEWIEKNKDRFVRVELLSVINNTGIPANCNRGVVATKGKWIKLIAGDDRLKEDCIESNIRFAKKNQGVSFIHSRSDHIIAMSGKKTKRKEKVFQEKFRIIEKKDMSLILNYNSISAPTIFFTRSLFNTVKGFDESIGLLEDRPFYVRVLRSNFTIHFLDKKTIDYRIHLSSVKKNGNAYMNKNYAIAQLNFNERYRKDYVSSLNYLRYKLSVYLIILFNNLKLNNKNLASSVIFRLIKLIYPVKDL